MAIKVKVDDHRSKEVEPETGLTAGRAIARAYGNDTKTSLRPRSSQLDTVKVDGKAAKYDTILKPETKSVTATTDAYQTEQASTLGDSMGELDRAGVPLFEKPRRGTDDKHLRM